MPAIPDDEDELGPLFLPGGVEQLLHELKFAFAADERRLEPRRAHRAPSARDHPQRAPERHRLRLALELVHARVLVGDRGLGRALGRLADEDGARPCGRLDPGGRVDEIARDHALARRAERHRRLAA